MQYIWRILLSLDQLANVVFGPVLNRVFGWKFWRMRGGLPRWRPDDAWHDFGLEDETMSSVFGKNERHCVGCYWICRALHWFDKDHCKTSTEHDEIWG